jgi:hypothetical protein
MATPGQSTLFTTFTELVSTTYRNHKKEVADNMSNHNALYRRIAEKGKARTEDGGLSIVLPLEYADNSTFQRYSGYDTLNIQAVDVLTSAEFPWRQAAVNVAASGLELRNNSGDSKFINLAEKKLKNAVKSAANSMSNDIYSDGTLSNQIGGLQALVSDAGTGTVGGINSTTYTFWKSLVQSAAAPIQGGAAVTMSASTIEDQMLNLWIKLTRGADKTDLIVMDDTYYAMYEKSQVSLKRYTSDENGKGGMISLKYKTADVFFDTGGGIPTAHAYFLNTDYLEMVAHEDANWTIMDEMASVNQDACVIPILFQGNMVCSNRSLQGCMKG